MRCTVYGNPCPWPERHDAKSAKCPYCGEIRGKVQRGPEALGERDGHTMPFYRMVSHKGPCGNPCGADLQSSFWAGEGPPPETHFGPDCRACAKKKEAPKITPMTAHLIAAMAEQIALILVFGGDPKPLENRFKTHMRGVADDWPAWSALNLTAEQRAQVNVTDAVTYAEKYGDACWEAAMTMAKVIAKRSPLYREPR